MTLAVVFLTSALCLLSHVGRFGVSQIVDIFAPRRPPKLRRNRQNPATFFDFAYLCQFHTKFSYGNVRQQQQASAARVKTVLPLAVHLGDHRRYLEKIKILEQKILKIQFRGEPPE